MIDFPSFSRNMSPDLAEFKLKISFFRKKPDGGQQCVSSVAGECRKHDPGSLFYAVNGPDGSAFAKAAAGMRDGSADHFYPRKNPAGQ